MKKSQAAGIIVCLIKEKIPHYLVLQYANDSNYWGFAKGHTQSGEHLQETALREVYEETGINDIQLYPDFQVKFEYLIEKPGKEPVFKTVILFFGITKSENVILSSEHRAFKWLPFKEAKEQLTYEKDKNALQQADQFLIKLF
jgi:bis(5'-nucleosidyl)-tetraphosphatase